MHEAQTSALLKQGENCFISGNLEEAKKYFVEASKVDPEHVDAFNNLGVVAFQEKKYDAAISYFKKAAVLDPKNFEILESIGKCWQVRGNPEKAVEWYQKALEINGHRYETLNFLGDCWVRMEAFQKAIDPYQRSLKINPHQANVETVLHRLEARLASEHRAALDAEQAGEKKRIKVLYVDTISTPTAACNINGTVKAFMKVSQVKLFDYRLMAQKCGVEKMNHMLVQTALEFKPDLIHLGKSESISGLAVKAIKERIDTCVIHFYGDFRWDPQPWVVDIGKYADYTLFNYTDERILSKYRAAGVKNIAGFWDSGADPSIFYPRKLDKTMDVVFMGSNLNIPHDGYEKRRQLVEGIVKQSFDLHIFGENWQYLLDAGHENLHLHAFVTESAFAEVCSQAKITLGINGVNHIKMYASWRRAMNTMASGAFHLTHYVPGMETFFKNKQHLVWFNSVPEALDLIAYYLQNEAERDTIAEAGRNEILKRHTWDERIADQLRIMNEYYDSKPSRNIAELSSRAVSSDNVLGTPVSRKHLPTVTAVSDEKKIFIVGAHGAGKSTLIKLLNSNRIKAEDENPYLYSALLALTKRYYYKKCDVQDELKPLIPKAAITANVAYFPFIPTLKRLYPHSRFIYITRNGIEQVNAALSEKIYTELDQYAPLRLFPEGCTNRFEQLCWYWNEINQIMLNDLAGVKHMRVENSALVSGKNLKELSDFIGAPIDLLPMEYTKMKKMPGPDWTPAQASIFTRMCGGTMKALGYPIGLPHADLTPAGMAGWLPGRNAVPGPMGMDYMAPDAFMVAYAKAGRTWIKVMLAKLIELMGYDTKRYEFLRHSHAGFDPNADEKYRTSETMPAEKSGLKIVLLYRDPRDIVVSDYFECSKRLKTFGGTITQFMRSKKWGIENIVKYYNEWYAHRDIYKDFMLLKYEDLKNDALGTIKRLVHFFDLDKLISDEMIRTAIEYGSFSNMRKMEMAGKSILNDRSLDITKRGNPNDKESFKTRKGKIGGYLEYFNQEDLEFLNDKMKNLHPGMQHGNEIYGHPAKTKDTGSATRTNRNVVQQAGYRAHPQGYLVQDTYIITHPKTGSTLLRCFLERAKLLSDFSNDPREILPFRHADIDTEVMATCSGSLTMPREKSHLNIILMIRDPRTTVVSYFRDRLTEDHPAHGMAFSDFIRDSRYGLYSILEFYRKWLENKHRTNRLSVVFYEDLLAKPKSLIDSVFTYANCATTAFESVGDKIVRCDFYKNWIEKDLPWDKGTARIHNDGIAMSLGPQVSADFAFDLSEFYSDGMLAEDIQFITDAIKKPEYSAFMGPYISNPDNG